VLLLDVYTCNQCKLSTRFGSAIAKGGAGIANVRYRRRINVVYCYFPLSVSPLDSPPVYAKQTLRLLRHSVGFLFDDRQDGRPVSTTSKSSAASEGSSVCATRRLQPHHVVLHLEHGLITALPHWRLSCRCPGCRLAILSLYAKSLTQPATTRTCCTLPSRPPAARRS